MEPEEVKTSSIDLDKLKEAIVELQKSLGESANEASNIKSEADIRIHRATGGVQALGDLWKKLGQS